MQFLIKSYLAVFILLLTSVVHSQENRPIVNLLKVPRPTEGFLYHGIHLGGDKGQEDVLIRKPDELKKYIEKVGRNQKPFFVYFSQEWGYDDDGNMKTHRFPIETVRLIAQNNGIPFIRLMLRSSDDAAYQCVGKPCAEKYFTLANILDWNGRIDRCNRAGNTIGEQINCDLIQWGNAARLYGKPLIVEWGTEVNNHTFHWNAEFNGQNDEASALFRKVYRHIVRTVEGPEPDKSNITWVFHVTPENDPPNDWNRITNYFPDGRPSEDSRDYVDWVGVSIYGATDAKNKSCETFDSQLDKALNGQEGLLKLPKRNGTTRPVFVLEFGATEDIQPDERQCKADVWTRDAFLSMNRFAKQGVAGFSWWSERYKDDTDSKWIDMRVREFSSKMNRVYQGTSSNREGISRENVIHAAPR